MKVQDVTPEYIKALQAARLNPSINDVINAKVQDVTPEFIARARQHGFKDLTSKVPNSPASIRNSGFESGSLIPEAIKLAVQTRLFFKLPSCRR